MFKGLFKRSSGVREVGVEEARRKLESGQAVVLDVRQPGEWRGGHIVEALHIPLGELGARVAEIPRDREVLTICRSGNRSKSAAESLGREGFERVASVAGGMRDWESRGYPVQR